MSCVAQSSDQSSTENVWLRLKYQIGKNFFNNCKDLMTLIEEEWIGIPNVTISKMNSI